LRGIDIYNSKEESTSRESEGESESSQEFNGEDAY